MSLFHKQEKQLTLEEIKTAAWNNAPKIIDKPESEYRVCMFCQFPMKHSVFLDDVKKPAMKPRSWAVEKININKSANDPKNLLAVHQMCLGHRKNDNESHRLKKYQKTKWLYPKDIK